MGAFLNRYLDGEYEQVWTDLLLLQGNIHEESLYLDAVEVAEETMRRVKRNIDVLIPRLEELGYQFGYEWLKPVVSNDPFTTRWIKEQPAVFTSPSSHEIRLIETFEHQAGLLPLSLRTFYLEVGSVNFVGIHPEWEVLLKEYNPSNLIPTTPDALYVLGLDEKTLKEYKDWKGISDEESSEEKYTILVAPDSHLKYGISGEGASYEMEIPNNAIDGVLLNEWHQTTFMEYLRICFRYAGFPGLARIKSEISEQLDSATRDLLPF